MTAAVIDRDLAWSVIDPKSYADDRTLHAALRWLRANTMRPRR